jgi:hypothetical protein
MATFTGTVQQFHVLIGPRIRNAVNVACKRHRDILDGVCQDCGKKAELQSAHVHGRDRRTIIESVLMDYVDPAGLVTCNLLDVERRIIEAHHPIEQTFRFLCHPCHVAYDAGTRLTRARNGSETAVRGPSTTSSRRVSPLQSAMGQARDDTSFGKLNRVRLWATRPQQVNHRIVRAFLSLERDGAVPLSALREHCTSRLQLSNFDAHYASMKTDAGNAHGKVFYDDGRTVRMWPVVRQEVGRYFD